MDPRVKQAIKEIVTQLHRGEITSEECSNKINLLNNIYNNKELKQ